MWACNLSKKPDLLIRLILFSDIKYDFHLVNDLSVTISKQYKRSYYI